MSESISKLSAGFTSFVFAAAQISLIALYPFISEKTGIDLVTLIACFSIGSFCFVVGSPFWALKSDSWGRSQVLAFGTAALLVSFAILFVIIEFTVTAGLALAALVLSRLIYGFVASALPPVAQLIWRDTANPIQIVRAMSNHSASLNLGRVTGLSIFLIPGIQAVHVLAILFALMTLSFGFNFILSIKGASVQNRRFEPRASVGEIKGLRWVLAIALVFTVFVESLSASLGGTLHQVLFLDAEAASKLTAHVLLAASVAILFVQIALRSARLSWKAVLPIGILALLIGALLLLRTDSVSDLWIAIAVLAVGIALVPPSYLAMLHTRATSSRGTGILTSTHTIGYALGGVVAAMSFELAPNSIAYALSALALILAFIFIRQLQEELRGLA